MNSRYDEEKLKEVQELLREVLDSEGTSPKAVIDGLLARGKSIYGADSRMESADSPVPPKIADAVCVMFEDDKLEPTTGNSYHLDTRPFGQFYGLCSDQPFVEQPVLGFGTGFLVMPNVIATAGHNVRTQNIRKTAFLFDYAHELDGGNLRLDRLKDEVYFGEKVLECRMTNDGVDFAMVQLDRPVVGQTPLEIRSKAVAEDDPVYVVGHPSGLPKKWAGRALVTNNDPETFFVSNLDTFEGNSGSPVFDSSHRVCGILVRGKRDFIKRGDCFVMAGFPLEGGGEEVCRSEIWRSHIPI